MTTLAVRLAGPLQSWGSRSRFVRRETERAPTKSGVIGMLAAAQGRRRTDPVTDLVGLRFGVRVDQPGRVIRDFQTARSLDGTRAMPLSDRYYLADAVFVAMLEGPTELLEDLLQALRTPHFAPYLGRRSCPPARPIPIGVQEGGIEEAFVDLEWQAAPWYQEREQRTTVVLDTVLDADPAEDRAETVRDEPLSFDPRRREYGWRSVRRGTVEIPHPDPQTGPQPQAWPQQREHNPMTLLGE